MTRMYYVQTKLRARECWQRVWTTEIPGRAAPSFGIGATWDGSTVSRVDHEVGEFGTADGRRFPIPARYCELGGDQEPIGDTGPILVVIDRTDPAAPKLTEYPFAPAGGWELRA
jgi:hypothetical protein